MHEYNCTIRRVVDGDTVDVDIDLGFDTWIHNERVRLYGIDTPESRTRDLTEKWYGKASKAFLEEQLKDQEIQLVSHDKGKFGRILGELFIGNSSYSINKMMIDHYHAVPYTGASKELVEEQHMANRQRLKEQGVEPEDK